MIQPLLKPTKRPKKKPKRIQAKVDPLWLEVRADWFELNPPNHEGYYQCGLCPYWVHCDETVLDHIKPKGAFPELKYVLSNLQPAHWRCNTEKGSMSMEQWCDRALSSRTRAKHKNY